MEKLVIKGISRVAGIINPISSFSLLDCVPRPIDLSPLGPMKANNAGSLSLTLNTLRAIASAPPNDDDSCVYAAEDLPHIIVFIISSPRSHWLFLSSVQSSKRETLGQPQRGN